MTSVTSALLRGALANATETFGWLPRLLGVTDPRSWAASDWSPEVIPYVIYGWVAAIIDG